MKYYLIAGEASGDLHASNLIRGIRHYDADAEFRGWGGDYMREAGCHIVKHYRDTAIMGFIGVLKKLGHIRKNIRDCRNDILAYCPDVVIPVDYGGFNMKIARFVKRNSDIPVFYYISPKIWAWNTGRVKKIKAYTDRMFVILPFEVDFYKKFGYRAQYAGNPLTDAVCERDFQNETFEEFVRVNDLDNRPIVALLAGSRSHEIKHILPVMLEMPLRFPDFQFVIAGAPSMKEEDYCPYIENSEGRSVKIVYGQTYRLLVQARAALVTSGTATLETALLKTPQVVCYKGEGGRLSYLLFKMFVKVKFISLVNLIAGREVVKELLMQKLNPKNLEEALKAVLYDSPQRKHVLEGYEEIAAKIGPPDTSRRFALMMVDALKKIRR